MTTEVLTHVLFTSCFKKIENENCKDGPLSPAAQDAVKCFWEEELETIASYPGTSYCVIYSQGKTIRMFDLIVAGNGLFYGFQDRSNFDNNSINLFEERHLMDPIIQLTSWNYVLGVDPAVDIPSAVELATAETAEYFCGYKQSSHHDYKSLSAQQIARPATVMLIGEFLFSAFAEHVREEYDDGGYSFNPTQRLKLLWTMIKKCPHWVDQMRTLIYFLLSSVSGYSTTLDIAEELSINKVLDYVNEKLAKLWQQLILSY